MTSTSNQRLAQNTFYLYVRMILLMLVALYTSRVVINVLGVEDFGVYNIIGGIVVLFSFLNNAMTSATQRFFSYELGRNDEMQLKKVFNTSLVCHFFVSIIVAFLGETIGLWFVYTQLNIPPDRIMAAHWVYQLSILTFVLNVMRVPYNAIIISYERMSLYAYITIAEASFKLIAVFLLYYSPTDKLVLYAILMALVPFLCNLVYLFYCKSQFLCCKSFVLVRERAIYRKLSSFFGWSLLGGASNVGAQHGGNILINLFHGVTANAGFGVANQASHAVSTFVNNFQTAFNPQLVKLYAQGNIVELNRLMMRTSLFSFYLMWILSLPLIINMPFILQLWLKTVPPYADLFCILMLMYYLVDAIQAPLFMTIYATGSIRTYQIWLSAIIVLNIPISWLLLILGYSPVAVIAVRLILNIITSLIRTFYIKNLIAFDFRNYVVNVVGRAVLIAILSTIIIVLIKVTFARIIGEYAMVLSSFIIVCLITWFLGLVKSERENLTKLTFSILFKK